MTRVLRDLETFPAELRGCALSIGKFDGVHRGHVSILERLKTSSRVRRVPSVVFTFDPSPGELIRPHLAAPLLCTTARKVELISLFEPDAIFLFPTTREFLRKTAEEFFREIILDRFDARVLVEGGNFTFGANREGNIDLLHSLCLAHEVGLQVLPSVISLGREVSSSRVRSLVREGQIEAARGMLLQPYRFTGYVVHGEHRGRQLGFPTANLAGVQTIMPKEGLYAAMVHWEDQSRLAAVNIGGNPTFGVETFKIEIHLLDFSGDLYGKTLDVDFIARIRNVVKFESREQLLRQIDKDIENVRQVSFLCSRDHY